MFVIILKEFIVICFKICGSQRVQSFLSEPSFFSVYYPQLNVQPVEKKKCFKNNPAVGAMTVLLIILLESFSLSRLILMQNAATSLRPTLTFG